MDNNTFVRLPLSSLSVYVNGNQPFWFVPSPAGDTYLQAKGHASGTVHTLAETVEVEALEQAINPGPVESYEGRAKQPLTQLTELWIHLTDNCNLSCKHCLFSCRPETEARQLALEDVKKWIEQAYSLGTRLVIFTGGEPFVYPDFLVLLTWCLAMPDLHVAVLTNGLLLSVHLEQLAALDQSRLHFQISLDGLQQHHEALRGLDTYGRTMKAVSTALARGLSCSTVMAINAVNMDAMAAMVEAMAGHGIKTMHWMWHFQAGQGRDMVLPESTRLIDNFKKAADRAKALGVTIDNLEALRSQLFSPIGTRFDLTNAGWESLCIGPDGHVYPTPALMGREDFDCGCLEHGLEDLWRHSPKLDELRRLSVLDLEDQKDDPWRFILGGGDLDHRIYNRAPDQVLGMDPYMPLYKAMLTMLLEEACQDLPVPDSIGLVLRMGDVSTNCPSGDNINFTHGNCLLSMGSGDQHSLVRAFYTQRALDVDHSILNPVYYDESQVAFIPQEGRVRQYGCGSPVSDAGLQPGETVLDLGCGAGVEVFLAAKAVGPRGRAWGVDMTRAMLDLAKRSQTEVERQLGFGNITFKQGYLEDLPWPDASVDAVISNCVINLTSNKRRVFKEILRVLKPGGRMVISDVVTDAEPPLSVRASHKMKGECLGGAYVQPYLFSLLQDMGFVQAQILKRFPYRQVQGHAFFSLTFQACKGLPPTRLEAMFMGPGRALVLDHGQFVGLGERRIITVDAGKEEELETRGLAVIDPKTGALIHQAAATCACCIPEPAGGNNKNISGQEACVCDQPQAEHREGCLICGAPLTYLAQEEERRCECCHTLQPANAVCAQGHFVCDRCHAQKPLEAIEAFCLQATATDLISLYHEFKSRYQIPQNGPEHHALVPGLILAAYRNSGGAITDQDIKTGLARGQKVPGGTCGFMGICGAAIGAGIAFGIIKKSTPLTPGPRQQLQSVVARLGAKLSDFKAARCCQRETVTVLKQVAAFSRGELAITLTADEAFSCSQYGDNKTCIGPACPLRSAGRASTAVGAVDKIH